MNKDLISEMLTPSEEELQHDRNHERLTALSGALPHIGTAVGVYLSSNRIDWKFDRTKNVLILLDERISTIENGYEHFARHIHTEPGADLLEEGIEQSQRALTEYRQDVLSRVLAKSLTRDELDHQEDFLILSTLRSLSEYELIHFIDQATRSGIFKFDSEGFRKLHPEILYPRSSDWQSDADKLDSTNTQKQYKAMLAQKGLLDNKTVSGATNPSYLLSSFGRTFFRKLDIEEE